ncbi:cytochrome p450 like protein [Zymoseptoria brevis]|uniref:Cytochrome p450 like protein n=1 Tax=Zymoseptoria brevis TaxID=1047168 RepID=A0A0F4G9G1_9PEZI|nr:cytochrome p450 like protein [Zymoseptoria brevis]
MFLNLVLATLGLTALYIANCYRCFRINLASAKQSGVPYICLPVYTFDKFWLVTHKLWLPFIGLLPKAWTESWVVYLSPEYIWTKKYDLFKDLDTDVVILVAPGANTMIVADPEANTQITTRRNDFPKPIWLYTSLDLFGKNVVSTEGANWRHHRKITSPPFSEKNNVLVWKESLTQAECMMTEWVGTGSDESKAVWSVASETMRLSLHIISRAGFGVRLHWPHENRDDSIPAGHSMTYKGALETLLHRILTVILTPRWMLANSPLEIHKIAYRGLTEWGLYMREMYTQKREEVEQGGGDREGMDLMGALVEGAGISSSSKKSQQLLTDDEILGNAFVFILAGHETAANTLHFSILFLAMKMASQRHLQKDLDDLFGDRPASEWSYDEDLPKLFGNMCGAVMNEQLRLIPPVTGIPKFVDAKGPQGLRVGDKHVTVPAGCYVTLNTIAVHRNPKYWPHTSEQDLLDFRPERWLLDPSKTASSTHADDEGYQVEEGMEFDQTDKRPDTAPTLFRPAKGAYMPFSDGYRSCLGRRFAQVEILAVLAVMFKTWTVELDVSAYMSDAELKTASEEKKKEAWAKADKKARQLLNDHMGTIITIQIRGDKVPFRFVKRGKENFKW